jgi:hypothetical protein
MADRDILAPSKLIAATRTVKVLRPGGLDADRSIDRTLIPVPAAITGLLLIFAMTMRWPVPAAIFDLSWGSCRRFRRAIDRTLIPVPAAITGLLLIFAVTMRWAGAGRHFDLSRGSCRPFRCA